MTAPASVPVRTDRAAVATILIAVSAVAIAQGLTFPLIAVLMQERGASSSQIAAHAAALMVGLAVSVLVLPFLSSRFGPGTLLSGALAVSVLGVAGFLLTEDDASWLVLRLLLGFCVNTVYVTGEAWLGRASAPQVRGRISGIYNMVLAGGFCVGPMGIPLLGTQGPLPFLACSALLGTAALGAVLVSSGSLPPSTERTTFQDLPRFARAAPRLLVLVLTFAAIDAVAIALLPAWVAATGGGANGAAIFVAVMHGGMVLTQPLIGAAIDRFDAERVAKGCVAVTFTAFAGMLVAPAALLPLAALGGASFMGLHTCALTMLGAEHRGALLMAGTVAFSLAYSLGATAGLAGGGMLADRMPSGGVLAVLLACLVCAATLRSGPVHRGSTPVSHA